MEVRYPAAALEGPLPIALVNTVFLRDGQRVEGLADWDQVQCWYDTLHQGRPALGIAPGSRREREEALLEIKRLREACRAVFEAHVESRVDKSVLAPLNELLRKHLTSAPRLNALHGEVCVERFAASRVRGPMLLVILVAEAIVDLFSRTESHRIKRCASPACILFFVDQSKARTRSWCSMRTCGNRHKAALFYERHKTGSRS